MEAIEALLTRRSVRQFTSEPVDPVQIETILRAAMNAPSACNQQPWHFVVVTSRQMLDAIAADHPYAQMLLHAPLCMVVCAQASLETCPNFWVQDCSAAMLSVLLAAHAQGLGAVWCGVYPNEKRVAGLSKLLCLPNEVWPLGLAAIGHPAGPLPVADRFRPERVHQDAW